MWLDILILVPGLHYQQAADELGRARGGESAVVDATESHSGRRMSFKIKNAATALFIQRVARAGETVILDVGVVPGLSAGWFPGLSITTRYRLRRSDSGMHATVWPMDGLPDLGWVSHLLYLISPVLTIAALVFVILFRDCECADLVYRASWTKVSELTWHNPFTYRVDLGLSPLAHALSDSEHLGDQAAF